MCQEVENRLIQAILKQAEKVSYYCHAENVSPDLAIHEIRKCFKRIRALLKFFPESMKDISQKFTHEASELGKELSVARESYINLQLFKKILEEGEAINPGRVKIILGILDEKHKEIIEHLVIEKKFFIEIQTFIYELERKLTDWLLHPSFLIKVPDTIITTYTKSYDSFNETESDKSAEHLHDLRKKMKVLWYQIDFAKQDQPKFFKLKANELRKITELLGTDHDWYVFQNEIKKAEYFLTSAEIVFIEKQIQHFQSTNHHKLMMRLKKFFSEPPELFGQKIQATLEN